MTKLIVALRNFANVNKNTDFCVHDDIKGLHCRLSQPLVSADLNQPLVSALEH